MSLLQDMPQFTLDTRVKINVTSTGFTVIKQTNPTKALPFSEADLLQGMTEHYPYTNCLIAPHQLNGLSHDR
jgi:hypothetical protein